MNYYTIPRKLGIIQESKRKVTNAKGQTTTEKGPDVLIEYANGKFRAAVYQRFRKTTSAHYSHPTEKPEKLIPFLAFYEVKFADEPEEGETT